MSGDPFVRRIAVVSTTRADYGLLVRPMQALRNDGRFQVDLIVTGQHFDDLPSLSARAAEDGLSIADAFPIHLAGDDGAAAAKAVGLATLAFADVFARIKPALLMILGDRYEILAPVQAALLARIPIAHLCGGDVTEGVVDDAVRHAVSKLSHLHFPATALAARRLLRLGEPPERVTVVGNPGLDYLLSVPTPSRQALFDYVGLPADRRLILVSFHPETLDEDSCVHAEELVKALEALTPEAAILATGSNADPGARAVEKRLADFCAAHPATTRFVPSLGPAWYPAALSHADVVAGNSSSGLYEAPSLKTPTVNIGDRQKGREQAASVVQTAARAEEIVAAVRRAWTLDCSATVNPYGDGRASEKILAVLAAIPDFRQLLRKPGLTEYPT